MTESTEVPLESIDEYLLAETGEVVALYGKELDRIRDLLQPHFPDRCIGRLDTADVLRDFLGKPDKLDLITEAMLAANSRKNGDSFEVLITLRADGGGYLSLEDSLADKFGDSLCFKDVNQASDLIDRM